MRNDEVIKEFLHKNFYKRGSSVTSDQNKLFSYNTVIAQWFENTLLVNNTKYSPTTSKAQRYLIREIDDNVEWYTVDNVRMGTSDLKYLYHG
jgi:hypothetical protein